MSTPHLDRTVRLSQAEIGLIFILLQEDLVRATKAGEGPRTYQVIPTGEVCKADELMVKFASLVTGFPVTAQVELIPPDRWASKGQSVWPRNRCYVCGKTMFAADHQVCNLSIDHYGFPTPEPR
jgi:hypothetical protein